MSKAIISNRIYINNLTEEELHKIKESLTYKLPRTGMGRLPSGKLQTRIIIDTVKDYILLKNGVVSMPQSRTDLIPSRFTVEDRRVRNVVPFPDPKLKLRELQQDIYNEVNDSCIINAKVGFGKTFLALHCAAKLQQKTLVITHTTALRDQWIEEAKALFGMPVGIIGSGKFDIEDHFIVVANIQSMKKHLQTISKEFGTVIVDEMHHTPATTFTEALDSMYSRYRIGLSGTLERKDGRHVLFTSYFSNTVFKPPQDNTLTPTINIVRPGVFLEQDIPWAQKMNKLLYDEDYQKFIANLAVGLSNKGHKVLIVASRIQFLEGVKNYVGKEALLVVGGSTAEEKGAAERALEEGTASVICGSRQIFSEGISVNILSALIVAEPISYTGLLEQLIGRIQRKHDNKLPPEVYDIQFSDRSSNNQNKARLGFYIDSGWVVNNYH